MPDTVGELLAAGAARSAGGAALRHPDGELTHDELAGRAAGLAGRLADWGVRPGDRLALALGNDVPFVVAHAAAAILGAVVVPLPVRGPGWRGSLAASGACALVLGGDGRARADGSPSPSLRLVVRLSGRGTPRDPLRAARGDGELQPVPRGTFAPAARPDDPAALFLSSGTTGEPKRILLTHRQLVGGAAAWQATWGFDTGTVALMAAPFAHIVYAPMVLGALGAGGTAVPSPRLDVRSVARAVERHGVTGLMGPPAFWVQALADEAARRRLQGLDLAIYGAAPMPVPTIAALRGHLPSVRAFNCYGLTETASALSVLRPGELTGREDSVGRPHPGVEVTIRDEDGGVLPDGERGEVCCRGAHVITGYDGPPGTDADRFHDDWLRTGDVGSRDPEGFLRLHGRTDDVINVAGEKVYPCEVEAVLGAHPGVAEVAVTGVADSARGEVVAAVVVPVAAERIDAAELRRHCARSLPRAFVPRRWRIVAELPRNASGKVVRSRLPGTS